MLDSSLSMPTATHDEHLRAKYVALLPHGTNIYGGRISLLDDKTVVKTGEFSQLLLEAEAMRYAAKHTSIPIPVVYDVWNDDEKGYLAMEFKQGRSLQTIWPKLSPEQQRSVVRTLKGYVDQLRAIPQPSDFHGAICSALNGNIMDYAVDPDDLFPSCSSETIFNDRRIAKYAEPFKPNDAIIVRQLKEARSGLSENHSVKFTHSDLAIWNIHVNVNGPHADDVEITAILDWEQSGWRPEHWETFKFLSGVGSNRRLKEWRAMAFEEGVIDSYSAEVGIEYEFRSIRGPL
ncbi:hypothetical protein DXG03_002343 [Asterophora parasitica]|uniref:Aminoglycoside phosphotransferase domain-containing protein n=1 Tax=Asterophora parasitica TaxID=117018 RepID=A0A9P7G8I3_9AGAR|nr:hypothetical protein DXG03_002343 [Asterophora parasitica]